MNNKLYFAPSNDSTPLCIWKHGCQDPVMENLTKIFGEPFNKEFLTTPYDVMDKILNIVANRDFGIIDDVIFNITIKYDFEKESVPESFIPEIYECGYNSGYTDWWEGQQEVYLNWICSIEFVENIMNSMENCACESC